MRKLGKLLASIATTASIAAIATAAQAQSAEQSSANTPRPGTADQAPGTRMSADDVEYNTDIVVTASIRRSLEEAAGIKQDALQVVDSIVAEDIGKFPDPTTAAALQRVPGIQTEVGADNEIAGVRIRGLNDILTTIDGREVFSTTGRNFDLQDLPATALARVDVIKTSTANLIEGGIAGLIDLQLNKPFKFRRPALVMTARGNYAVNDGKFNPQFAILATDRWQTGIGEIGALVNVSYRRSDFDRPYLYENIRRSTRAAPFNLPGYASQNVAGGVSQNGTFDRTQANAALQWQASPFVQVYLDGIYTNYHSNNATYFMESQLFSGGTQISNVKATDNCFLALVNPGGQAAGAAAVANGTATQEQLCEIDSATYTNPTAFASTQARYQNRDNYVFGGGVKFDRGRGHLKLDVAYQKSKDVTELFIIDIGKRLPEVLVESNTPDGGRYTFTGNPLNDPAGFAFRNGLNQNFQKSVGELFQARIDGSFDLDGPLEEIQYGVRFANRSAAYDQALVNTQAPGGDLATLLSSVNLHADFLAPTVGIPGINDDAPWLSPNPDYLRSAAGRDVLRGIYNVALGNPAYAPDRHFDAREKTMSGYGQMRYAFDLGGAVSLDGAFGARATWTDRRIAGAGLVTTGGVPTAENRVAKTSDFDFLPNASIRARFGGGLQARLVYARAIRRPDFGSLNPGLTYIRNFNPNVQPNGSAGNPDLKSQKTDSYDATLEYFFKKGYLAVGGYYRNITNRVVNRGSLETIDGFDYIISRPRNIGEVTLKGVEAGGQMFFDFLPGPLSGLGAQANFTYADSKVGGDDPLAGYQLIGVSKYNFNVGLLYEKHGLSGRLIYNYRSTWITQDATGLAGVRPLDDGQIANGTLPRFFQYVRPGGRLDFGIGYDLTKQVRIDVGGTNILRHKYRSYFLPGGFNGDTRWDDATYTIGIRARI